jgi:hypothetical protein
MKKSILLFEWAVWFFVLILPPQFPALGLLAIQRATGFFISHRRSSSCILRHRSQSCLFSQLYSGALCAANCFFDLVFAIDGKLVFGPSSGGPFCFPVARQGINSSLQIFLSHKISRRQFIALLECLIAGHFLCQDLTPSRFSFPAHGTPHWFDFACGKPRYLPPPVKYEVPVWRFSFAVDSWPQTVFACHRIFHLGIFLFVSFCCVRLSARLMFSGHCSAVLFINQAFDFVWIVAGCWRYSSWLTGLKDSRIRGWNRFPTVIFWMRPPVVR